MGIRVSYDLVKYIGAGHVFRPHALAPTLSGAMGELSTMKRTLLTAALAALTLGAVQATEIDWALSRKSVGTIPSPLGRVRPARPLVSISVPSGLSSAT